MIIRVSLAAGATLALAAMAGAPVASAKMEICTGAGKLTAQSAAGPLGSAHWQVSGNGQCASPREPQTVTFGGKGTSDSLGLCTPGHLIVQRLSLGVRLTLTAVTSGRVTSEFERWTSPITLFPLATPFLVESNSGLLRGAGVVVHHIHLMCGDDGSKPSATFLWTALR
jgi:hypothetical protein